jgi:hypothetical protein
LHLGCSRCDADTLGVDDLDDRTGTETVGGRRQQAAHENETWTFARAGDELTIVRPSEAHGRLLVVTLNDSSRTFTFPDEQASMRFQADMETLLTHTGWSFVGFLPERRNRRDRRSFPRLTERRRWWTDGWLNFRS